MKEEKINSHRIFPIIGIILSAVIASGVLCYLNKLEGKQIICVVFLVLAFIPIIIFELTYERHREMIGNNSKTTFKRVAVGFAICNALMLVISFMPEYFRPVLLLPVVMSAFSNDLLGLITGMFFNILLALTTGGSFHELLAYSMLVLVGGMLSKMLKHMEYRLFIGIIYLFSSVLFPNLFFYFVNETIPFGNLILGSINGMVVAVFVIALYPTVREKTVREKHYYYGNIIADEYKIVRQIRRSSPADYYHARKVSEIAYRYATQLGLKSDLAAAAGFYYRLGKWEGGPPIESAVRKAMQLCFPDELIQILREFNATDDFPSTQESALIHMVDGVLNKIERLEAELETSQWDKKLLIHQILDEFSSNGLYDKSGMSINSFIKIRDWLTQEALL